MPKQPAIRLPPCAQAGGRFAYAAVCVPCACQALDAAMAAQAGGKGRRRAD